MHQFNEYHPYFNGFSKHYHDKILPILRPLRKGNLSLFERFRSGPETSYMYLPIALTLLIIVFFALVFTTGFYLAVFSILLFFPLFYIFIDMSVTDKFPSHEGVLLGEIANYLEFNYTPKIQKNLLIWRGLGLIESGIARSKFTHCMTGSFHGTDFELVKAELFSGAEDDKLFEGHLITITFPRSFTGRTIVVPDKGHGQPKVKSDLKKVGLVDPVFERMFEVYSSDQVAARTLLSPDFMQKFVDLKKRAMGKNISFGFLGGELRIAVDGFTHFKDREYMLQPATSPVRTQLVLDELAEIFDIIDHVLAYRKHTNS